MNSRSAARWSCHPAELIQSFLLAVGVPRWPQACRIGRRHARAAFHLAWIPADVDCSAGAVAWVRPGEPRFQGKALSLWLQQADPNHGEGLPFEAKEAICRMGSNAVPHLVRMLEAKDSPLRRRLTDFFYDQDWGQLPLRLAYRDRYAASLAFEVLGPAGVGAIPKLQALLDDEERAGPVAIALAGIGPEAITALTNGLASTNSRVRIVIVRQIGNLEAKASAAIPALVTSLGDADASVAAQAARSLGRIHDRPGQILPVLLSCLSDSRSAVRKSALGGIANFEAEAGSALPHVLELMGDPDEYVRSEAFRAVCKIEKEPIPLLISQLQHPNARVRQTAAMGLASNARQDTNAFNALTNLLNDEDEAVQEQAAKALKSMDRRGRRGTFRMKVP